MWEETLVFTLHMAELALVRFLVWDHDPIGQDFIGQRTIAFNSMMPGKVAAPETTTHTHTHPYGVGWQGGEWGCSLYSSL